LLNSSARATPATAKAAASPKAMRRVKNPNLSPPGAHFLIRRHPPFPRRPTDGNA
jgi:hypothetical protein